MFKYPEHPPAHIQVPSQLYFGQFYRAEDTYDEVLPIRENLALLNLVDDEDNTVEIVHVLEKSPATFSTLIVSGDQIW